MPPVEVGLFEGNTDDEATSQKILKVRADKGSISNWHSRYPQFISLAMIGTWNLPGAVGILRDQAEELPLHQTQPKPRSSTHYIIKRHNSERNHILTPCMRSAVALRIAITQLA